MCIVSWTLFLTAWNQRVIRQEWVSFVCSMCLPCTLLLMLCHRANNKIESYSGVFNCVTKDHGCVNYALYFYFTNLPTHWSDKAVVYHSLSFQWVGKLVTRFVTQHVMFLNHSLLLLLALCAVLSYSHHIHMCIRATFQENANTSSTLWDGCSPPPRCKIHHQTIFWVETLKSYDCYFIGKNFQLKMTKMKHRVRAH